MNTIQAHELNSKLIPRFVERQCALWDTARYNIEALAQVKERTLNVGESSVKLQFNPARITSSTARIDTYAIQERKCFLCAANRPPEQYSIAFPKGYEILVNPYPILPLHLTIVLEEHQPQAIARRLGVMLQLAHKLEDFVIFYNGPRCGASAPDHTHFQAGSKGILPIEFEEFFAKPKARGPEIAQYQSASLRIYPHYSRPFFEIHSTEEISATYLFSLVYDALAQYTSAKMGQPSEEEPMMNLLVWYTKGEWVIYLFPRARHRPLCYDAQGDQHILLSPGAVDMGGLFAVPQKRDFDKITPGDMEQILSEVCFSAAQIEEIVTLIRQ